MKKKKALPKKVKTFNEPPKKKTAIEITDDKIHELENYVQVFKDQILKLTEGIKNLGIDNEKIKSHINKQILYLLQIKW